jgi:hypothetical protein
VRLAWLLAWVAALAAAPAAAEGPARSPRNANTTIEATLDPEARLVTARQVVTWRNLQERPAEELRFHLYWNAWRNDASTWMREDRYRERRALADPGPADWGYLEIESARLGGRDLTPDASFASPDDGNPHDRTVWVLPLPEPVPPGGEATVELAWLARVPSFFARTGVRGDFWFLAHWFPALGVFEADGWNCHQFHAATEFFSDYGVYDVTLTLPKRFVVGATGREIARRDNGDGTASWRFLAEDVHTFTWTASPDYLEVTDRFGVPGLPAVDLRLLLQPEHRAQAARHLAATKAALELYGRWYGPYPYGHVTIVDPAWGSDAGGMEYPTLFTAGTRLWNPAAGGEPEGVTIHEAGHQFWYGIVGNDELEHAWLDAGLNTFSEERAYAETYGEAAPVHRFLAPPWSGEREGFLPVVLPGFSRGGRVHLDRLDGYRPHADSDVQRRPSWTYDPRSGRRLTYNKTSLWLGTLERRFGWEALRGALAAFFARGAFRHPTPEDLLAAARETAGPELAEAIEGFLSDEDFDYAIQSAVSYPEDPAGLVEEDGKLVLGDAPEDPPGPFRSEVVVRRHGSGTFPVDVVMVFEDGSELRRRWSGGARWRLFATTREAKLAWAAVDPEGELLLDLSPTNNSLLLEPRSALPAAKWAARWLAWFQDWLGRWAALG